MPNKIIRWHSGLWGGAAFDPLTGLTGLLHYFDPQDTLDLEGDAQPASTVVNTGPGANLTGQTGAARPTINDLVIGGQPALNFNGTSQRAWAATQNTNDNGTVGLLMFCVFQTAQISSAQDCLVSMPEAEWAVLTEGSAITMNALEHIDGDIRTDNSISQVDGGAVLNDGAPHIVLLIWDPSDTGHESYLRVDGVEVAADANPGTLLLTSELDVVLGDFDTTGNAGRVWDGDLGITGICSAPNVANISNLESFLDSHYGGGII